MPALDAPALTTPCLLLDRTRMERNLARLRTRITGLGARLRPHLKTAKSVEIARLMMDTPAGPATVSTLKEAEQFAAAGVRDLTYAVGIAPDKLARAARLRAGGAEVAVLLDSLEQAREVAAFSRAQGHAVGAWIEIDSDGHRSGVAPGEAATLIAIGRALHEGGAALRGVLTHAGGSYHAASMAALETAAEGERAGAVRAAETLRQAGLPCPGVSVGSTPTAHFARNLAGVTEVRAGVYVFMDLVMAGLGVCTLDDIAISVLATVIGHQPAKGWLLVDAGWMAMSRDRSSTCDWGYGVVADLHGHVIPGLVMTDANQEHGILTMPDGAPLPELPVGTRLRILPNHACATAAQFDAYHLLTADGNDTDGIWPRFSGW